jgi:DNA-binding MarR family transcriptional regulator
MRSGIAMLHRREVSSLSRIFRRAIAFGSTRMPLVHRTVDESDRRSVLALLTPRGRTGYRSLRQAIAQEESELFALLDGDAQELCSLLARAYQRLP